MVNRKRKGILFALISIMLSCSSSQNDLVGKYYKDKTKQYSFIIELFKSGDYNVCFSDRNAEVKFAGKWKMIEKNTIQFSSWHFLDSLYEKPLCNCTMYNAFIVKHGNETRINFTIDDDSYSFVKH